MSVENHRSGRDHSGEHVEKNRIQKLNNLTHLSMCDFLARYSTPGTITPRANMPFIPVIALSGAESPKKHTYSTELFKNEDRRYRRS